jgi:hypothetical protein
MKAIDVEGLPEPIVQALAAIADALRHHLTNGGLGEPRAPVDLPLWPGKVNGDLTREEIYEHI